jgi:hypothetical protein
LKNEKVLMGTPTNTPSPSIKTQKTLARDDLAFSKLTLRFLEILHCNNMKQALP